MASEEAGATAAAEVEVAEAEAIEAMEAEEDEAAARAAQKRYEGLQMVKAKAVKGKGAWYWAHLEPVLVPAADSGLPPRAVKLRCSLCAALFSASNPSRTASEHLKRGTCPNFAALAAAVAAGPSTPSTTMNSPVPISTVAPSPSSRRYHHRGGRKRSSMSSSGGAGGAAFVEPTLYLLPPPPTPAPSACASHALVLSGGREDLGALAMLEDSVRRLKSPKASPGAALPKPQADAALAFLVDWLHEAAGAGGAALSAVDHPKLRAFLRQVGLPPLSRRELAGPRLDAHFAEARVDAAARVRDALFFQLSTDGWREPVVTLSVNLPNGTSVFHRAVPAPAPIPSDYAEELLLGALADISGTGPSGDLHRCAGIVADRFKSKALRSLEGRHHWMVNLSCQLHGLSCLVRDFARELPLFRSAATNAIKVATFFNANRAARTLFHKYQLQELGRSALLRVAPTPLDWRVGDFAPAFAMLDDILSMSRPLQLSVIDESYKVMCLTDPLARELGDTIQNAGFWTELEAAHSLVKLISDMMKEMETERPLIGQCLPMWEDLRGKVRDWCDKFNVDEGTILKVVEKSFNKNYHPAWSAAFILDPLYLYKDASGRYLPPFKFLTPEQEKDVDRLITRMVSREEAHLALMELMKWRSEGLDPLYAQAVQVRQPDPATGKMKIANKQSSRLVWETCLSEFRSLAKVAIRLIFLHATARGFKCSPAMVRWLSSSGHSTSGIEHAHKLLFVAANSKFERRDFSSTESVEAELFADGDDDVLSDPAYVDSSSV